MLTEILAPTSCPDCSGAILVHTEPKSQITTHHCVNQHCPGRLKDMLTYIADRKVLEIEGLGPELAATLVDEGYVTNMADLYRFQTEGLKGVEKYGEEEFETLMARRGFPGAMTLKMILSLETAKTASWPRWIAALGIPMIGERLGKVLAEHFSLKSTDMLEFPNLLAGIGSCEIPGFGFHKTNEVLAAANDPAFRTICAELYECGVRPTPVPKLHVSEEAPLAGVAFAITGDFPDIGPRDFIKSELAKLGAVAKSSVTKKCNLLLVGQEYGATKIAKATELDIRQVGEAWLMEVFDKYEVEHTGHGMEIEDAE
jgi:DNA ligase (NAD+)